MIDQHHLLIVIIIIVIACFVVFTVFLSLPLLSLSESYHSIRLSTFDYGMNDSDNKVKAMLLVRIIHFLVSRCTHFYRLCLHNTYSLTTTNLYTFSLSSFTASLVGVCLILPINYCSVFDVYV